MYFERDPRAGMGSVYAMLLLQKGTKEVAVIHFMHAVREFVAVLLLMNPSLHPELSAAIAPKRCVSLACARSGRDKP